MNDCIFCAIVSKDAEASIVYEDERVLAFMDHQPVTTGHLLVIPREHLAQLGDVPAELAAHVFTVAQRLAAALRQSGLPCEGINLFLADGEAAFHEVFHAHLHVFPRTKGDGFGVVADWRVRPRPELDAAAAAVRSTLGG
jgi:diadenosine tetraphosphate (Ap4A) HIT family hydrolase